MKYYAVTVELRVAANSPEEADEEARHMIASGVPLAVEPINQEPSHGERCIFVEAALSNGFVVDDPDMEGAHRAMRKNLAEAIVLSGIRTMKVSDALEKASEAQKRVLGNLIKPLSAIPKDATINDLIRYDIECINTLHDQLVNVLQYQTRSICNKTGLHSKEISLHDLRAAKPAGHMAWTLPGNLTLSFRG